MSVKRFDIFSFRIGLLYLLKPEVFSSQDLNYFFTEEDIAQIEARREFVAERMSEFNKFWKSKKGRDNVKKRSTPYRDPEIEKRILEIDSSLSAQQVANKLQIEGIDVEPHTVVRIRKKYRNT